MFVSLGGNCAITYQLNKYKLRNQAYPFDWCRISIKQLINVLENNFKHYHHLSIQDISNKHQKYDNKNNILSYESTLFKNSYGILFAHEVDDIEILSESLKRRIQRFKSITDSITFIRLELSRPNGLFMKNLVSLCIVLYKYFTRFRIKLIIHKSFEEYYVPLDNVDIYYFEEFCDDWKFEHLNWNEIFK